MGSSARHDYDLSLLVDVAPISKPQMQRGYDASLLAPNRRLRPPHSEQQQLAVESPGISPVSVSPTDEKLRVLAEEGSLWGSPRRWWARPIVAVLIVFTVVGAVVGSSVAVTAAQRRRQAPALTSAAVSASTLHVAQPTVSFSAEQVASVGPASNAPTAGPTLDGVDSVEAGAAATSDLFTSPAQITGRSHFAAS
ncbi:unnamed protein product [Mycena citricolor]|uniref:Uncharacterized protein n=1 Tax=Mycena citricolor TaxID=2018698 RepID=A0AAD2H7P1_9AGAR|nr:unnamed protein product [Mycena citricolor]